MKKTLLSYFMILLFLPHPPAWSEASGEIKPTSGRLRISFEELTLAREEKMGFVGGTFLYDVNEWFSLGMGSYGALTGERGGFITLGFASELKMKLNNSLLLRSGLFVGAGGGRGGFTLQGGGLMLRPHFGFHFEARKWGNVGLGFSHVRFPNGNIRSTQPYFSYEYPFDVLIARGWREKKSQPENPDKKIPSSEREFAAIYRTYFVPDGVLTDGRNAQHKTVNLLGVEWHHYMDQNFFLKIESEGAMGGRSNGYMQIFLGGGYRLELTERTKMKIAAQIGVAGGGSVSTGGGFLTDISLGLQQYVTDRLYFGLAGAYVDAPGGSFRATSLSLLLGYGYGVPVIRKESIKFSSLANYTPQNLRLRTTHQTYFRARSSWRRHHADQNVNLIGLQADYFLGKNVYISGQGIGAYEGKAGGYMTGLWGAGYHLPLFQTPAFIDLEVLLGAAGGGGLDVAGGLVWQTNTGIGLQLTNDFSLIGSAGYISAPKGNFRAKVVGVSLAYHFTIFTN